MTALSFLQNKKKSEGLNDDSDKKIEFAQKLPSGEVEGKAAPKGGDFNFLRGYETRQPGDKSPVKIIDEQPVKNIKSAPQTPVSRPKADSWLSGFSSPRGANQAKALQVNLVKDEIVKYFNWQRGSLVILISIFSTLALISFIYWGISVWGSSNQASQNGNYLQQYYKISKELNSLNAQVAEIKSFKVKLDQANFLISRHIYWTNFFNFLETNTLSNVYYSGFSGTISGDYSLSATCDNLAAIDPQIKKFLANPLVKKVAVDSGSMGDSKGNSAVSFSMAFTLDPKIFLK
jgi:hypothetical protein